MESVLHRLAAELDADVTPDPDGTLRFSFPAIDDQFVASETVRHKLRLENRELGEVVYSTSDSAEAGERELALFDRQLDAREAKLDRYLSGVDKIAFEDDYELVAFEEELMRRGLRAS